MSFDRKRRGKGRDKRDSFGDESYDGYQAPPSYNSDFGGRSGGYNSGGPPSGGGGYTAPRSGGGGGGGGFASRPPAMPAQVVGSGTGMVKFFNAQKGFGFIQCDNRPDDVFVHISAVEQAGLTGLAEGQPLEFTLVDRGGKVSASDLVIVGEPMEVPAAPAREERAAPARSGGGNSAAGGEHATGTVKFFNDVKGFGFVQRDDGGEDVFVHISALERGGVGTVAQGDRLEFDIELDRRGKLSATNLTRLA
jgi:CspA family cold shock protein